MEKDTVELFDYLGVIWKRKILIIVVILVCTGVGVGVEVGVKNSTSESPVTYQAVAVLKIGKRVKLVPTNGISSSVEYIENPGNLVETIPLRYSFKIQETPGCQLNVDRIGQLAMLRLTMKSLGKGAEAVLKEIVDMLIDEHSRMAKDSVVAYESFMRILEVDAKATQRGIDVATASLSEMKKREGEYLMHIEVGKDVVKGEGYKDQSAFLNMLYLKTIDKERELSVSRGYLQNIMRQLMMHRITLGNLEEYSTELIGEIKNTTIDQGKSAMHIIVVAGVAGLIMSLFIAFFMQYIEESKTSRKEK